MESRLNSEDENDNISKNSDSNDSSNLNESESNNSNENDWNLDIKTEEKFLIKLIEDNYFYKPDICPCCNKGLYIIKKYKKPDIINIFFCECNNKICRKKVQLRNYSIFKICKNIPASVFFKILEWFFQHEKNATKIIELIKDKFQKIISIKTITKILHKIRIIIYLHMKKKYESTLIGGFNHLNKSRIVAIDECLIGHNKNGEQIWLIGGIETKEKRMRLMLSKVRNAVTLEKFVNENFYEGTHFTHDGWNGYIFLDNNISFTHEEHLHGGGDFGYGSYSTSHIEGLWNYIKKIFIRIYYIMPRFHLLLYLREIEFRINISQGDFNNTKKILKEILYEIYILNKYEFSDDILEEEEIILL